MCGLLTDTTPATPATPTVQATQRVPRSQQRSRATGLTLNEQRQIERRVARGAALLDAVLPGWATKRDLKRDLKAGYSPTVAVDTLALDQFGTFESLLTAAEEAGHRVLPRFVYEDYDGVREIDGAAHGLYETGDYDTFNGEVMVLDRAWTQQIAARTNGVVKH